jgi:hypothetical protein
MSKIEARQFALLERRVEAARLWRLGYPLRDIAERLKVSAGTAFNDIQDAHKKLQMQQVIPVEDKRVTAWFEQEIVKHEAFREWERSKQDLVEVVKVPDPNEPDQLIIKSVKTTGRLGDPRYLTTAQAAERRQAEIYGTDVDPKKIDPFASESEIEHGSRTFRGTVPPGEEGRAAADAVRGSCRVEVDVSGPIAEETPAADQVPVPKARRPVRRTAKNKGVRGGPRVRKK